jgi:signal transduction histidine kinase
MVQSITNSVFKRPEERYLLWLFPQNKKSLGTGLIFTFITISMLSVVDVLFYSDLFDYATEEAAIAAGGKTFEFDNFFRLIFAPIFNIAAIFTAYSAWNKSMRSQNIIVAAVLTINVLSFLFTGMFNDYYTAAKDFTYEALVLILFSQTLFGLTFRISFFYNFILVSITIIYLFLDDDPMKEFLYSLNMLLLVWIPVVVGTLKLEKSRMSNFYTITKLENANVKAARQKNLMKTGESVSQLLSWNTSKDLKQTTYSDGIYHIFELDEKRVAGQNLSDLIFNLIHPEDKEFVGKEVKKLLNGTYTSSYEYRIVLRRNKVKWLKCTIGEYIEGEGFYGTIQDITKDKLLELELQRGAKELKDRNEDLQQFAYASSHDLQEPLRSISNFVSILNRKMGDELNTEQKLYMDIIMNSTARMKKLINAILDYSRIGKNRKLEEFDCNEVLQNVLIDLNFSIEASQAKINVGYLPMIVGYQTEFSTLMQNLIGNAIKFRKKDVPPFIQVIGIEHQNHYQFSIKDNGIGMEEGHSKKIFQLFSRLHSEEEYEGTGIGLTHSKKIVEMHGGKIWVESIPNEGTIFHFTIQKQVNLKVNEKETRLHLVN